MEPVNKTLRRMRAIERADAQNTEDGDPVYEEEDLYDSFCYWEDYQKEVLKDTRWGDDVFESDFEDDGICDPYPDYDYDMDDMYY